MFSFIDRKIIPYVFKISPNPLRFKELLSANKVYHDGMNIENNMHGFKLRLGRTYLVFFLLWFMILMPVTVALHSVLAKIDCHAMILMTVLLTGAFFISFSMFKEFLIDRVALMMIKKSWGRHFRLFDFEEQAKSVADYYGEAVEKEIPIGELQRFIFDKLSQ